MADSKLTLYHYWRSSSSWRVRWALAIKGISYEKVGVNLLTGAHLEADYTELNPAGQVPLLVSDSGLQLGDSLAILEWLEERYPAPALLPRDPDDRAFVRRLAQTVASGTQPIQNFAVLKHVEAAGMNRAEWGRHWVQRGLQSFQNILKSGPHGSYCYRSQLTFADLCLIPQLYNARRFGVDLQPFDLLRGIEERCLALDSCHAAAPDQQPDAQ